MALGFGPERVAGVTPNGISTAPPGSNVVVVGGGLAGLAAAATLAERGVKVTVIEKAAYLGGRLGAWPTTLKTGETVVMERGFHAFFRQYYNLRRLMRKVDPSLKTLTPLEDYPLVGPDGDMESFDGLPRLPILNVAALVRRTQHLTIRDLLRVNVPQAMEMLTYDPEETYRRHDHTSAADYLDGLRFPAHGRQMLFDVFAHSFFNPEDEMSAAELLMMFHFYFTGNPEGLVFDVLNAPFTTVFLEPFARWLTALGVTIVTEQAVTDVTRDNGRFTVKTDAASYEAGGVVLSVNVPALKTLFAASPTLNHPILTPQVESLDVTLPFVVWRLWLDRPTRDGRAPFVGTVAMDRLDNVSLFHLIEDESRDWAEAHGGSVMELHAYGVPAPFDTDELRAELWGHLMALYPELEDAKVLDERYLERQDCPAFSVGSDTLRPAPATAVDGLTLAGDFVKLPFPSALMERATASGVIAANHLLARLGVQGEPVFSVPSRGVVAKPWNALRRFLPRAS
ncbi:MAG: isorenieratene synthase [Myxococcota bacterium]